MNCKPIERRVVWWWLAPRGRSLFAWALVLSWSASSLAQSAEDNGAAAVDNAIVQAESLAASAIEAYRAGNHLMAIDLYQQAYEHSPSADIVFNLARVYDWALHDDRKAMQLYRQAIAEPGARTERIDKARRRLLELQAAELQRQQEAQAAAQSSSPQPVVKPMLRTPNRPEPSPPTRRALPQPWAVAAGIGAVAAASVGAGFGLSALAKAVRVHDQCEGRLCESEDAVQTVQEAKRHGTIATSALISSGLFLGLATWLYFDEASAGAEPMDQGVQLRAQVSRDDLALQLRGHW